MDAPTVGEEKEQIQLSWLEIVNDWDTIVSDLYATYGSAVDTVETWPDLRRMILGLMGRRTSLFAVAKAFEYKKQK